MTEPLARIIHGDARAELRKLPAASIDCCVTSPLYWQMRDYGQEDQLGLEPSPAAYVRRMVHLFRGVRRVLKDDGTLWLNLGDTYLSSWPRTRLNAAHLRKTSGAVRRSIVPRLRDHLLKPKDLVGIPWRVALALQADGWYLRSDIVWHKPNPLPESVRDRPTKAHEYLFLLAKQKRYFYDGDAVREPHKASSHLRVRSPWTGPRFADHPSGGAQTLRPEKLLHPLGRNRRSVWTISIRGYKGDHYSTFPTRLVEPCVLAGSRPEGVVLDPFAGTGTTLEVALQHGRSAIGIELNEKYVQLMRTRLNGAR